jgi:hypothetical protein
MQFVPISICIILHRHHSSPPPSSAREASTRVCSMRALHARALAAQGAAQVCRRPAVPAAAAAMLAAPLHAVRAPARLARHAPACRAAAARRATGAARAAHSAPVVAASASATAPPGVDPLLHSYRRLQNGSDVRGVALPGVAGQDVTLDADRCVSRTRGVGAFHKGQGMADLFARAHLFTPSSCALCRCSAAFIAQTFVGWLAAKTGRPASELRVSVRAARQSPLCA